MKRLKHMIALLSMALLLCAGTSQAVVMAASSEQSSEDETATSTEQDAEDEAVPELAPVGSLKELRLLLRYQMRVAFPIRELI